VAATAEAAAAAVAAAMSAVQRAKSVAASLGACDILRSGVTTMVVTYKVAIL